MSYAFVQDIPATWDTYLGIAEALGAAAPEGLVIHVAGPTEGGFRMIGIWNSRETWDRFRDDRLRAIFEGLAGGSRIQSTYRELNIAHLLSGPPTLRTHDVSRKEVYASGGFILGRHSSRLNKHARQLIADGVEESDELVHEAAAPVASVFGGIQDPACIHLSDGRSARRVDRSGPSVREEEESCTYASLVLKVATSPIPTRQSSG